MILQISNRTTFLNTNTWDSVPGPPMNTARSLHGCATASYNGSLHVFVVGGMNDSSDNHAPSLDTIEVFNVNKEKWIKDFRTTKLPQPLEGHQVVQASSPNFFVYAVGGSNQGVTFSSTIYGLDRSKQWEKIGDLDTERYFHATINIGQRNSIPDCIGK